MTTDAMAMPRSRSLISTPVLALVLGLAVLGLLFGEEIRAAVSVWIGSTAYGHCFFIIPIALFLAWERRQAAAVTPVRPMPWVALAALPFGLVWLAAERLGIMEGQQIMAMGFVELLFLVVLGWRMWWVLAVPLLYLGFLVPFGAFVTPALQNFTAAFIVHGLDLLGIANFSDGNIIEIPEGRFFVAEACAGLRFLIASVAFGVLYACMIYRSPMKRLVFILASVAIPIVANGFRGLGIVALGHLLGSAEAAAVDHVVYGWLFFSFVILVLILAGLPFREDEGPLPLPVWAATALPAPSRIWLSLALVLVLAAIAPSIAGQLDRRADAAPIADLPGLGAIAGCTAASPPSTVEDGHITWIYQCRMIGAPGDQLALRATAFPPRANPGAMARLRRQTTGELSAENAETMALRADDSAAWNLVTTTEPDRLTATAEWIDARPAPGGLAQRRLQAWNSVFGSAHGQMLVTIATLKTGPLSPQAQSHARTAITALLDINPGLVGQVDAIAAAVGRSR